MYQVTEEELELIGLYRAMDADCQKFASAMFNDLVEYGKFFAKTEVMSHNNFAKQSVLSVNGVFYMDGREGDNA